MSRPLVIEPPTTPIATIQADVQNDQRLVEMWLHGHSPHTQRAYAADAQRFRAYLARPLTTITLGDVQAFADSLTGKPSSRAARSPQSNRSCRSASALAICRSTSAQQ